jgi:GAF domain-containing protein
MAVDQEKILTRLLEVTRSLGSQVDLETYLQTLLSAATELTGSDSASLLEFDEVAQEFHFKFVPWFHRDAIHSARVPLNGSVAGWVFLNVQPLAIDDVSQDPRHYKRIDEIAGFTTRSILAVSTRRKIIPARIFASSKPWLLFPLLPCKPICWKRTFSPRRMKRANWTG